MLVGYARVSSAGQSLDIQNDALAEVGCEKVFAEKMSGRSAKDRIGWLVALATFTRSSRIWQRRTSPSNASTSLA
ncbi:recombinase family protein, partial [Altererythrobacter sp. RZ02]